MRRLLRPSSPQTDVIATRVRLLSLGLLIGFSLVLTRLFYWQVIKGPTLRAEAEEQYVRSVTQQGTRGKIFTADGHALVTNHHVFRLFAEPHNLQISAQTLAEQLAPLLVKDHPAYQTASHSAFRLEMEQNLEKDLEQKLSQADRKWISLADEISEDTKNAIAALDIHALGFDPYEKRYYPEASLAAHVTGFVGKDERGRDIGYFGLEGALEKELKARENTYTVITDALGHQLIGETSLASLPTEGRTVVTTIRRDVQYLAESTLREAMQQYGAKAGEVVIMEPGTGKIWAMASLPNYDQNSFYAFDASLYKNPSLVSTYEPGSTLKVLTVAAGLEEGKITPDTPCPSCSGPRVFGQYTIRTWNDEYHPNISMTEALAKSDNTAMIFISELLGPDKFAQYLKNFGLGEKLNVELQEDTTTPFPQRLGPVELATTAFGQGVSTTSLQLVRAIGTIANGGVMMRPMIVEKVHDPLSGKEIVSQPIEERRVVSTQTAQATTRMMVAAAEAGEAQWTRSQTHTIAGKTGTSQIAVNGSYSPDKTIASFVGFAPADNPKFVMLVKFTEPSSSIWAAETAAPTWYKIANKLFLLLNVPPDK